MKSIQIENKANFASVWQLIFAIKLEAEVFEVNYY